MLSLPKIFEGYDEKRRNAFLALHDVKKKGKKVVGTFCSYLPAALVHAAEAIPFFPVGPGAARDPPGASIEM